MSTEFPNGITRNPVLFFAILPLDHHRPTMASSSSKARRDAPKTKDTFSGLSYHLTATDLGFSSKRQRNKRC